MEVKSLSIGLMHQHHHRSTTSSTNHHHHQYRMNGSIINGTNTNSMLQNNNNNNNTTSSNSNNQCQLSNCAACHKPIRERFLLKALDQLWHEDCLKCSCCDCRLGEVGSTLFTKANLILCKRDYLRLFGATGMCSACNKIIPAFEMVMRVRGDRVYHLECFQCSQCNHRFCIGDRFHLHDNRILCEYDFEELLVFGGNNSHHNNNYGAASNVNNNKLSINNHIEKLKKQTESLSSHSFSPEPAAGRVVAISQQQQQQQPQQPEAAVPVPVNGLVVAHSQDDGSSGYGSPDSLLSDGR